MSKKIFITIYDLFAKLLLAWFVFQSFMYFYTGRFLEEIESLKHFGRYSILLDIYSLIQIPVAAIGAVVLIPLILKGYKSGLVVGILYWIMGYIMNPLWYAFPRSMQATAEGRATPLLLTINIVWGIATLLIITSYYFYRRSLRKNVSIS